MIVNPLGFAGREHLTSCTRYGWSKALQLAADLYPGVGGKRFRAALLQQAYEFAGGSGDAPVAIIEAVEMLHAGSLVIDDFEDDSHMRRAQPALHQLIGPERAVNAGNWLYFRALELAGTVYNDPFRSTVLLKKFIEVARQCHEGQAIDLSTRVNEISRRQVFSTALAISRWKTGRLVSLAAWCGAFAAGGDRSTRNAAAAFGCRIGICLQMKNDLDELIAFAEGADRCDDLRNRRVTWPWAWAACSLEASRFAQLQRLIAEAEQCPAQLNGVANELVDAVGDIGASKIDARIDRAITLLARSASKSTRATTLAEVANGLRDVSLARSTEAER